MSSRNIFEGAFKYSLFAPLIVDERYMDVPEHLVLKAKGIRVMNSLRRVQEEMATEFDALIYLHIVSLRIPLKSNTDKDTLVFI